jgi:hypothetical protein
MTSRRTLAERAGYSNSVDGDDAPVVYEFDLAKTVKTKKNNNQTATLNIDNNSSH